MPEGSVKGTLIEGLAAALQDLLASGRLYQADLEVRLSREALALLEDKPVGVAWYPATLHMELLDVFWETAGGRDPEFMREAGRQSATGLIESGLYTGFVAAGRRDAELTVDGLLANTRAVAGMIKVLCDFVEIDVAHDAETDRLVLVYDNVELFSEAMFLTTQGFLDAMTTIIVSDPSAQAGGASPASRNGWRAERPVPGQMRFSRPVADFLTRSGD